MSKKYVIIFLTFSNMIFAQKNLKVSTKINGSKKETFTYYTDPKYLSLNIKHGNYLWESKSPNLVWTIKGKFNKDRKTGRWVNEFNSINNKGDLSIKESRYSYIDWTDGYKMNGEFFTSKTEENFKGITRLSIVTEKCLWKYNNNVIRSLDCFKTENGLQNQTANFKFDENGLLYPGEYCLKDCTNNKYKLIINENKFATQLPIDQYYTSDTTGDDIDEHSNDLANKYLNKELTQDKLKNQNIVVDNINFFNMLRKFGFKIGEDEEFIENSGQLIGVKGGDNNFGKYILHRNIKLSNEVLGTWKLKQMISNNETVDIPENNITCTFMYDTLTFYQNKNGKQNKVDESNAYKVDGKKNIILLKENNGEYVPSFSVLEMQENKILKIKSLSKIKEKQVIYIFQK